MLKKEIRGSKSKKNEGPSLASFSIDHLGVHNILLVLPILSVYSFNKSNLGKPNPNNFVYAMTGYSAKNDDDENTKEIKNVWKWNEEDGTVASSTGNVYGIYDLS